MLKISLLDVCDHFLYLRHVLIAFATGDHLDGSDSLRVGGVQVRAILQSPQGSTQRERGGEEVCTRRRKATQLGCCERMAMCIGVFPVPGGHSQFTSALCDNHHMSLMTLSWSIASTNPCHPLIGDPDCGGEVSIPAPIGLVRAHGTRPQTRTSGTWP